MAEAEAELCALNDGELIGTVRLGVFQSAITTLAVPWRRRLATTHPHLHVELVEMEPHESGTCTALGEADVIVTTTQTIAGLPWGADPEITSLGTDSVVLRCRVAIRLASRTAVNLAACEEETWACDRPQSCHMADLDRAAVPRVGGSNPGWHAGSATT